MKQLSPMQKSLSLILKILVILSAAVGVYRSAGGGQAFMGGSFVFMYFTIQSNIAIALLCAIGAGLMLSGKPIGRAWFVIKFVGTVSITLTGFVFCFVLAPTMGRFAWNIQNVLTHVIVPLAAIADFFVASSPSALYNKDIPYVTLPPLAYAIYAGIGYVKGWEFSKGVTYPYFFLNWGSPAGAFGFTGSLPFMGCAWWILLLLLFLCGVAWLYLVLLRKLKRSNLL